jgi:NAD(P)-dependent dehydrogenase (short-subunit alcohol dehydrogenase family)
MIEHQTPHQFANKVVIVTGAGSGIGRSATLSFARAGAHVLAVGRREDALRETAGEHDEIAIHPADIRADGAAEDIVAAAVARWGRVDVLVNNAGTFDAMPLADATASRIEALFGVHVTAPSLLARAALPQLKHSDGSIVNVSSTYGHRPAAGAAHYAAAKGAVEQLTRSWALELADDKIRVNAVASGAVRTGVLERGGIDTPAADAILDYEVTQTPVGRLGHAHEVAIWILHVADPQATWFTGQVITVDGGHELR